MKNTNTVPTQTAHKPRIVRRGNKQVLYKRPIRPNAPDDTAKNAPSFPNEGTNLLHMRRISLLDLNSNTCKWPVGDPQDENFHFCGRPKGPNCPYCDDHAIIAYQHLPPRKVNKTCKPQPVNMTTAQPATATTQPAKPATATATSPKAKAAKKTPKKTPAKQKAKTPAKQKANSKSSKSIMGKKNENR